MPEASPAPTPTGLTDAEPAMDAIVALLTRIERHLDRIARAAESMTNAPVSFSKELGAIRTMPEPLKR